MNNFWKDLETGKQAERLFADIMKTKYGAKEVEFNTSKDKAILKEWDVKVTDKNGTTVTCEIKNDVLSNTTGNFAIEYWGTTSASGINATTAMYWVMLSNNVFYVFQTDKLKEYISKNRFKSVQINNGTAYCYLVPIKSVDGVVYKTIKVSE